MSDQFRTFENRWTSGSQARQWLLRLSHEGESNIREIYAFHQTHTPENRVLVEDIPAGFARDWLIWCRQTKQRRRRNRHRVLVALVVFANILLTLIVWRIVL